jgi:hypothetical protein
MPRFPIDYTKGVIYKIVCKDPLVTEKYVGSTTDLTRRRSEHKSACNNPKNKDYNYFVYRFVRDHGGFGNWQVVPVENVVGCLNGDMLRARERFWFESLHAELNKCVPARTPKEWNEDNHEHRLNQIKEWYDLNREHKLNKMKEWYALNQAAIKERRKELRELKKANALGSMTQILI